MPAFARFLGGLSFLLFACVAHAAPDIPAALEPWRGWVLHEQAYRDCPLAAGRAGEASGEYLCVWPGVLNLSADASGADIAQHVRVDAQSWVLLPGDAEHWPQQVTVNGQPAVVVERDGRPKLHLAPGSYALHARIPWSARPQSLHVPAWIGRVALSVDGKAIVPVRRDGNELSLGRSGTASPQADSIELRVYRQLTDGIPAILTTRIELSVSGQPREAILGPVLPAGFVPLALASTWPARLDTDGRLRVRVEPGNETLALTARATEPLAAVSATLPATPWPAQEIWSYAAAPRLRVSVASGALQVDPRQAQVPAEWSGLPAFALADGERLVIEERSRGLDADARNRLRLDRELWLDFDGSGWFARDRVQGEMLQGWRFDAVAPYTLERADANGESLLVTQGTQPDSTGVEWRAPAVDLEAGLRVVPNGTSLPVTGWQDTFERVDATLHLPDGYRLLGAPGADTAGGSWVSSWTLFDIFIAALTALLAWRLLGPVGALVAIAWLVLGFQESGSPRWILLAAIGLALIARALPTGRVAQGTEWLRRAALAVLVLVALPFVATQLRLALHPQLENETGRASAGGYADLAMAPAPEQVPVMVEEATAPMSARAPAAPPPPSAADASRDRPEATITVSGSDTRYGKSIDRYSQSTVIQTGSGEPDWQRGQRYRLGWSGPVLPTQSVQLLIAPPWLVRSLRVALVLLLAWLIVRLVRPVWRARMPGALASALLGALAFGTVGMPQPAQAQAFPPADLLDTLQARIVKAPACAPACATLSKAEVDAHGDTVHVALEAHALERVALPLPADEAGLALLTVEIDGVAQDGTPQVEGRLWLSVPRGVHRIDLVYRAAADKIALAFPLQPMRIAFASGDWQASGIVDDRLLTETMTLVRTRESGAVPADDAQQFAPFVQVERALQLGLDWSVASTVTRLAPEQGGFTLVLPVLQGEHVSTPGFKVDEGRITVALGENDASTHWDSKLDKADTLTLTAPSSGQHAEVWHVQVSPTWHVAFAGVPAVALDADTDRQQARSFEFHPLPGEQLLLTISRPEAVAGATRAIDAVRLSRSIGQRSAESTLGLTIRASQGGEHSIGLPEGAELLGVQRDGVQLNLRSRDQKLSLPLTPGSHAFEVRWRDTIEAGAVARTPALALGLPAANIDLQLHLPADRWLLATFGPTSGPAVLYWGELIVMLLLAFALSRSRHSPLKMWQWVLLGIGFSTFSWIALLLVAAWLFALDWRARAAPRAVAAFNLAQIGLAVLTLVALLCLLGAVKHGLLGTPDMAVTGNGSSAHSLHWFADRSTEALPVGRAVSLPLWLHKFAMLAWALWLASALTGWLRRGVTAWSNGGYWRNTPKPLVDAPSVEPPRL